MCQRILALAVAMIVCPVSLAGPLAASEPTPAPPRPSDARASADSIQERLDRLELQVQLIQQHLGLRLRLPPSNPTEPLVAEEPISSDRLGRLEGESRRISGQLDQVLRQIDEIRSGQRAQVPVVMQGRLIVYNRSAVPHYLSVNRVQHYIQPGRTDIWVPYQAVEAYLPAHESPKLLGMSLWRWTGRDYEMPLEIRD